MKCPLIEPFSGPTNSGLNSRLVFLMKPHESEIIYLGPEIGALDIECS